MRYDARRWRKLARSASAHFCTFFDRNYLDRADAFRDLGVAS